MNEIIKGIKERRSVRNYQDKMVPEDLINQIVEAGTYAPTGMNKQSPIIIAVTDKIMRDKIAKLNANVMGSENDPFYGAPVVLIVLANKDYPTYLYDGSLVMGNLLLAAHSLGLGACWIHRAKEVFETKEGHDILASLGIDGDYEGIGNCIVGYPNVTLSPAGERKDNYIYKI